MRMVVAWILGLALLANGAFMLLAPAVWYGLVPNVADTGPFNPHFLRDVGAAYLAAGGGLVWFAIDGRARPAAVAGAAFLALHALVHLWDAAAGRESWRSLLADLPTVILPALLIVGIVGRARDHNGRTAMWKWLIRRRIAAYERRYDYDTSYVRAILDTSPRAFFAFGRIEALASYCRDVPPEAYYAAKLVAASTEDCGPCTQLVVRMAEHAGVTPSAIKAVLARDESGMTPEAALGFRFAEAVLAHEPRADRHREEIVARWGRHALVSLGFAIAASRVFPTVKYALGYGQSCTRVTVAGAPVPVLRRAA